MLIFDLLICLTQARICSATDLSGFIHLFQQGLWDVLDVINLDGNPHIVKLIGAIVSPMPYDQAKPLIQTFLVNSEGQKLIKSELAKLKEKSKIEYVGAFAKSADTAGAKPEAKPAEKNNSHIEKGVVGLD